MNAGAVGNISTVSLVMESSAYVQALSSVACNFC